MPSTERYSYYLIDVRDLLKVQSTNTNLKIQDPSLMATSIPTFSSTFR